MPAVKYLITTRSPNLASPSVMLASKIGTFTIRTKITPEKKKKKARSTHFQALASSGQEGNKNKRKQKKSLNVPMIPRNSLHLRIRVRNYRFSSKGSNTLVTYRT